MKNVFQRAEAQKRRAVKLYAAIQRRKVEDEVLFKALGLNSPNRSSRELAWYVGGLFLAVVLGFLALAFEIRSQTLKSLDLERQLIECRGGSPTS